LITSVLTNKFYPNFHSSTLSIIVSTITFFLCTYKFFYSFTYNGLSTKPLPQLMGKVLTGGMVDASAAINQKHHKGCM